MRVILASASPRRKELLSRIISDFDIIPAKGEEIPPAVACPEEVACYLAQSKCNEVFSAYGGLVIGCDTIVVFNGRVLGKPKDKADAFNMLRLLSGNVHSVITGVCVRYGEKVALRHDITQVTFNELPDDFIINYIDGGSPMDKAGSYGIQDEGVVRSYKGSYTNVVGMPVELVEKLIKEVLDDDEISN